MKTPTGLLRGGVTCWKLEYAKYLKLVPSPRENQAMQQRNTAKLCDIGSVAQSWEVLVGLLKPNSIGPHFKTKNLSWHLSRLKQQRLQENWFPFWNKCGVLNKRTSAAWTAMWAHLCGICALVHMPHTAFFQFNQQYLKHNCSRNFTIGADVSSR